MNNQSEDRVLGYVGTYPVGDYNAQTEYEYLNVVTHKGSSYVCIKEEGCIAVEPPNEECWQLFAGKGDTGEKGEKGDIGPIGPKPVNGVDYNTNAEREEFKNAVVADSKADLEKYITEKETHLDNYTKEKETKLDDYVTDTVKPVIDTYVTDTTKKDIDAYEKKKEKVLDTYTDTKKTEIDNYVTNTSKPALDKYEKDKEAELETAKNTAISEYDAHAETLTNRIADLEEETEDLFNALDTEKASGTELYIEDAKPCRVMNTEFGGMYKQKTTEGYNLFNLNTILSKHYISVTGTVETSNNYSNTSDYIEVKANKTYLISYNYNTLSSTAKRRIATYNSDKTCLTTIEYELSQKSVTITPSEDGYIRFSYDINCTDVQVVEGTENKTYESYTGGNSSPNLNYLQEIEQVESVKLMHDSSNLFNVTDYTILNLVRNGNAKITKTKDNFSFVTSTENYCGVYIIVDKMKEYIDNSKDDITYNISFDVSATQNTDFRYGTTDFKYTTIKTNKTRISFSGILAKPFTLYSLSQQANTTVIVSNIKVTKNEDTEYTTYQNQTINIDLKGNKLCAVSDTIKDKLLVDRNGNIALQKNVIKIDISNLNNNLWRLESSNTRLGTYNLNLNVKDNKNQICNYSSNYNKYVLLQNSFAVAPDFVRIRNAKNFTTVEDFKNWLQKNNLYAYCEIKNTQLIDLGQLPELLKTFEGINNIWAETNIGNTEIEIEYVQDVKKLLEKQAEQQNARLDNIEALLSTTETSALLLDNMQTDLESEVK